MLQGTASLQRRLLELGWPDAAQWFSLGVFALLPFCFYLLCESSLIGFRIERRTQATGAAPRLLPRLGLIVLVIGAAYARVLLQPPQEAGVSIWSPDVLPYQLFLGCVLDLQILFLGVYLDLRVWKASVFSFWALLILLPLKGVCFSSFVADGFAPTGFGLLILAQGALCVAILFVTRLVRWYRENEPVEPFARVRSLTFRCTVALLACVVSASAITGINFLIVQRASVFTLAKVSSELNVGIANTLLLVGAAWTLSMPLIVLTLLLMQQVILGRIVEDHHDKTRLRQNGGILRRWLRRMRYWRHIFHHLSATTSTAIAVARLNGFRIAAGLSLNVFLSLFLVVFFGEVSGGDSALARKLPLAVYVNVWAAAVISWLSPFAENLVRYTETREASLSLRVSRDLDAVQDHVVIVGIGDMGQRVLSVMQQDATLRRSIIRESREAFLPGGERVRIVPKLLLVDKDESRFAFLAREKACSCGLIRLSGHNAGQIGSLDVEPWVGLGVHGDIQSQEVWDRLRVERCLHFLGLTREVSSSLATIDYLVKERMTNPSIVAVSTLSPVEYYSGLRVPNSLILLQLPQLRAMSLAEVIAARLRHDMTKKPYLIFVGSGEGIGYTIDALWRVLPSELLTPEDELSTRIYIITDDPYYANRNQVADPAPDKDIKLVGLGLNVQRASSGCPTTRLVVRVIKANLELAGEIEAALHCVPESEPSVLTVIEPDPLRQVLVMRETLSAIRRANAGYEMRTNGDGGDREKRRPSIVVAAEAGVQDRAANLGDALLYYAHFLQSTEEDEAERTADESLLDEDYPRAFSYWSRLLGMPAGDRLIDVLEDPSQRVVGVLRSLERGSRPGQVEPSVEVSLCLRNRPGSIAEVYTRAAGCSLPKWVDDPPKELVSVHGTRVRHDNGQRFIVGCTALLVPYTSAWQEEPLQRGLIVPIGNSPDGRQSGEQTIRSVCSLLEVPNSSKHCIECAGQDCPDMATCPIATFRVHLEARNRAEASVPSGFFASEDPCVPPPCTPRGEARFSAMCDGGQDPGLFARLFAAWIYLKPRREPKREQILNVMYGSDYPCHDKKYLISTWYGNLTTAAPSLTSGPFRVLVIRPVTKPKRWLKYGRRLLKFLQDNYAVVKGDDLRWKLEWIRAQGATNQPRLLVVHSLSRSPLKGKLDPSESGEWRDAAGRAVLVEIHAALGGLGQDLVRTEESVGEQARSEMFGLRFAP